MMVPREVIYITCQICKQKVQCIENSHIDKTQLCNECYGLGKPVKTMKKFKKKPVTVEAFKLTQSMLTSAELDRLRSVVDPVGSIFRVKTIEGELNARVGDWIIRGVQGEYYPCKPDIFEETYEEIEGEE